VAGFSWAAPECSASFPRQTGGLLRNHEPTDLQGKLPANIGVTTDRTRQTASLKRGVSAPLFYGLIIIFERRLCTAALPSVGSNEVFAASPELISRSIPAQRLAALVAKKQA
jgi:hypothetical protein